MRYSEILYETSSTSLSDFDRIILNLDLYKPEVVQQVRKTKAYAELVKIWTPLVDAVGVKKAGEIKKATRRYEASAYGRMNNSMRSGATPKNSDLIALYIQYMPKFKGSTLYRGVGKDFFNTLEVGETFTDMAFVSTTSLKNVALHFAKRKSKGGLLVITGATNKAAMMPASMPELIGKPWGEGEYLLPAGSTFKVLSKEHDIVELQLI